MGEAIARFGVYKAAVSAAVTNGMAFDEAAERLGHQPLAGRLEMPYPRSTSESKLQPAKSL
jgi:hypothetical protein